MAENSDAFVFFGATGDLAYKQIFPALQSLTRRGRLDMPVIGVAKSGWTLDQLRERARASLQERGGVDEEAFSRLVANLKYVDGDYRDPETFERLRRELGGAVRPLHYLAVPPSMFTVVAEGLAGSGPAEGARIVVEKPFGRDLATAQELDRCIHKFFPEQAVYRIDHYLGKEPVQNLLYFRFRLSPEIVISLGARTKVEGEAMAGEDIELVAHEDAGDDTPPYERLLRDALKGDSSLFTREDAVEASWRVVDPVLGDVTPVHEYEPGTWGPREADELTSDIGGWHDPA